MACNGSILKFQWLLFEDCEIHPSVKIFLLGIPLHFPYANAEFLGSADGTAHWLDLALAVLSDLLLIATLTRAQHKLFVQACSRNILLCSTLLWLHVDF